MAMILSLKCQTCLREFDLKYGLLQKDLMSVKEGLELPDGGKLPSKKEFRERFSRVTSASVSEFINKLNEHQRECKGEVKLKSLVHAH